MDPGEGGLDTLVLLLSGLLISCAIDDRRSADLQLDVIGAPLVDTDRVRICVADQVVHESTVGHGRIAIGGLADSASFQITVNGVQDDIPFGKTTPVSLDASQPWAEVNWENCSQECTPCSIDKTSSDNRQKTGHMLAIHFLN